MPHTLDLCPLCLSVEDVQASAGAVRPAQLGALRDRARLAPGAERHLLPGGRAAGGQDVVRQRLHPPSPQQRVSLLSEQLPPQ